MSRDLTDNTNDLVPTSTLTPYFTGSYSGFKYGVFTLNGANSTALATLCYGTHNPPGLFVYTIGQGYCMLFEQTQSKFNTQTLTMYLQWSWGRTLSS